MAQPTYDERQQRIADYLASVKLVHGVGSDKHTACTISAINLALSGELTDDRDECMSPVVHRWAITVQDQMPVGMLAAGDEHGDRWRAVLPLIAGTNDGRDNERRALLLAWMWRCLGGDLVPLWVPERAREAWAVMLRERTHESAKNAAAAYAADAHAAYAAAYAADAAAADAADADAAYAAAYAAYAAYAYAYADAAYAYADAAYAYAADAAYAAAYATEQFWRMADPASVLLAICALPAPTKTSDAD